MVTSLRAPTSYRFSAIAANTVSTHLIIRWLLDPLQSFRGRDTLQIRKDTRAKNEEMTVTRRHTQEHTLKTRYKHSSMKMINVATMIKRHGPRILYFLTMSPPAHARHIGIDGVTALHDSSKEYSQSDVTDTKLKNEI